MKKILFSIFLVFCVSYICIKTEAISDVTNKISELVGIKDEENKENEQVISLEDMVVHIDDENLNNIENKESSKNLDGVNINVSESVNSNESLVNGYSVVSVKKNEITDISYSDFWKEVENGNVKTVFYSETNTIVYIQMNNDVFHCMINPEYGEFKKDLLEKDVLVKSIANLELLNDNGKKLVKQKDYSGVILFVIAVIGSLTFMWFMTRRKENTGLIIIKNGSSDMNFAPIDGDDEDEERNSNVKLFSDIAGLNEVKKDMESLVDFLKNKEKYQEAGAKLPKGVILYGPPGTGKTLLAKAVAGESGVSFLYSSASSFTEMYVGVGPKRVRELFDKAKKQAPCIIFIDELDAIGSSRGGVENSEDRKTINELLTQMDGFTETENILVIGATNRIEDLDVALMRPGRFTNKYCVPLPATPNERLEVINLYKKNKNFSEDVNFKELSKETIGFSPAKIEALLNEAAIISVQKRMNYINKETIDEAMFKMLLSGHIKENQKDRDKDELEVVAYHEAGHALLGKLNGSDVSKVTILSSTSGAGGVTFTTPDKMSLLSVNDLRNQVKELYAGRCAEKLFFNDTNCVTTGASNDIDRATEIIHGIVTRYGMTEEFGLLNLSKLKLDNEIILKKEIELSKQLEQETEQALRDNYDKLKMIAEKLLENETVYSEELDEIMKVS